MTALHTRIALFAATAGLAAGGMMLATPASAGTIPGGDEDICGVQLCLTFNSNGEGSEWYSDTPEVSDLGGAQFGQGPTTSGGNCIGCLVKNNAAWGANGGYQSVYVYVNSAAYGWGAYDLIEPGGEGNLMTTYNNEASYSIYYRG
ncbi:hypothetical protein [Kitasatospora viridis]|uniref:Peptidase inhibitor family I36 n=1 Tax=Kitasatospora viridis TaxID=281105 RepID=A0A561S9Q1_9ACTN|nr:hypothetical protein [Kitasatospora viridis]TWF71598.1 hypothetical protein FHX73_19228 [Kitasatospora viridis]